MNQLNASWSGHSFQWSQEGLDALAVEMKTKTVELEQATPLYIIWLRLISMGTKNNTVCESSLSLWKSSISVA